MSLRRTIPPRRMATRRRGASLLELLIVISTIAVILTVSVSTLHRLLRAESSGAHSLAASLTIARLAADFRRDAHAAATAELDQNAAGASLTFRGQQGEIRYAASGGAVQRTVAAAGKAQREEYRLDGTRVVFRLLEADRLAALDVERLSPIESPRTNAAASPLPHHPVHRLRIEAALNREHLAEESVE